MMENPTKENEPTQVESMLLCQSCAVSPRGRCHQCESDSVLVQLAIELEGACVTAMRAYMAQPSGAHGAMVGSLKTRLVMLTQEIAAEAGLKQ